MRSSTDVSLPCFGFQTITRKEFIGRYLGAVKTTYAVSAFLTPFPSNFHFAWYQQAGEGGSYDTLAERYGERIHCFTLTRSLGFAAGCTLHMKCHLLPHEL
jgi:hypothetical protein